MRNGERKKMHRYFVKLLRKTNQQFKEDDWFNGRFYLRLYFEIGEHYTDEYDSYPRPYIARYGIMAVDRFNPLNTGTYITDEVYFHKGNYDEGFQFERCHIHEFLNSWIQFCESGKVHDSPPKFNYGWMTHAERANRYIEHLPDWDAKSKDIEVFADAIKRFNPKFSKVYNVGDKVAEHAFGYNTFMSSPKYLKHDLPYPSYDLTGLCYKMDNGIILEDDDGNFLCAFFKAENNWYGCYFDDCKEWKPKWDQDRRDAQLKGVKIGPSLLDFIGKYDTDNLLGCWLVLQKTQVLN